jgi:DNA-binding winged helix-turn-helix (wHTH) protein/Tol biopolymer transport system component
MIATKSFIFRFADVTVREREFSIEKAGEVQQIQPKAFRVLLVLLRNPNKLITKEELLNTVWSDSAVTENSLTRNIALLRSVLGDDPREPRFIETVSSIGYRFVCPLDVRQDHEESGEGLDRVATLVPNGTVKSVIHEEQLKPQHRWLWVAGVVAAIATTAGAYAWWKSPPAAPVVESVSQLTDDGRPKVGSLVSDGSRIYFREGFQGSRKIMQVSTAGGETSEIPTRLADPKTEAIAPDGTTLMVFDGEGELNPLWLVPLPTGEPRRFYNIEADAADFFPDGRVVFARRTDLFIADKDGSNIRKLLAVGDYATCPRVSPDGTRIIFLVIVPRFQSEFLAEVSADGSGYHEVMRVTSDAPVSCGAWTADGSYVVAHRSGYVWAIPMRTGVFSKRYKPVQLTNDPLFYWSLCPSRDGKRIFAIGSKERGELVRYEKGSNQSAPFPFLSGKSVMPPHFSRDGQWVVYTSFPDFTLWRSRADGTDRMQLTYLPTEIEFAVISPDGKRVAFRSTKGAIVVMNMDGTSKREIPCKDARLSDWSPDGNSLLLAVPTEGTRMGQESYQELETIDLQSGKNSVVPSSQGIYAPASAQGINPAAWVASDTLIAATLVSPTEDQKSWQKLFALDLQSGKRTELASGRIVDWSPSPDRKYIYYRTGGPEPKCVRIRLSDRKVEEISRLDLRQTLKAGFSVAPDSSPIFMRYIGTQEIYSLTVKWP